MLSSPFGIGVSADRELLLLVAFDFDRRSTPFRGLIPGTAAFANQTFESQSAKTRRIRLLLPYPAPRGGASVYDLI